MKIKILFQYHNNMYDTVRTLETVAEVQFLSYRTSHLPAEIPNVQPRTVGRRFRVYLPWHLWRILGNNTDMLLVKHINDPINLVPYIICWFKKIRCLVLTQRIVHHTSLFYRALFVLLTLCLRATKVTTLATTQKGYQELKVYLPQTYYVPACINPARFLARKYVNNQTTRQPSQGRGLRESKCQQHLKILTVSKYQPRKNIPLVIEATEQFRKKFPNIDTKLTIIGRLSADPERISFYNHLRRIIAEKKLESSIRLVTNIPYNQMKYYYIQADIFILPAMSEPLGYAVLEAMASGLPILCSTDVGAASYVVPEVNGYLFAPTSASTISNTLARLVDKHGIVNNKLLSAFGKESRRIVEHDHSPRSFLQNIQFVLPYS